MGGMFTAIEQEEKALRMQEDREDIYNDIIDIEDINSESGQAVLAYLTEKLEKSFAEDSDDEDGITDKNVILTKMPWADLPRDEDKDKLQMQCRKIAKNEDLLLKMDGQLEFYYDFDLEKHTFLAIVLSQMFPKINDSRLKLVPDEVSDHEYWRNFFYHVELWKKEQGFPHRLGDRLDTQERENTIQEVIQRTEVEIQRLKQEGGPTEEASEDAPSSANDQSTTEQSLADERNNQTAPEEGIELQAV